MSPTAPNPTPKLIFMSTAGNLLQSPFTIWPQPQIIFPNSIHCHCLQHQQAFLVNKPAKQNRETGKLLEDPHHLSLSSNSNPLFLCPASAATKHQLQPSFPPAHIFCESHSSPKTFSPHLLTLSQSPTPVDIPLLTHRSYLPESQLEYLQNFSSLSVRWNPIPQSYPQICSRKPMMLSMTSCSLLLRILPIFPF